MATPKGIPSAAAAAAAAAPAVRRDAAVADPMEAFVFRVGCRTLLLSAGAMVCVLAVDPPLVPVCHLILLLLLWALGFALVHVSPALRGFRRAAAVALARALHRLFWEPRQ